MSRFAAAASIVVVWTLGCSVDRRSSGYECDDDGDCDVDRTCDRFSGYCVERGSTECPDVCTSCGLGNNVCRISCSSAGACTNVECPAGFRCVVECEIAGACGVIDCQNADSCEVTCASVSSCDAVMCPDAGECAVSCEAGNSCGNITCGHGPCSVGCEAPSACATVDCAGSCGCDVECMTGNCVSTICPSQGGNLCTEDGTTATPCDAHASGCSATCP